MKIHRHNHSLMTCSFQCSFQAPFKLIPNKNTSTRPSCHYILFIRSKATFIKLMIIKIIRVFKCLKYLLLPQVYKLNRIPICTWADHIFMTIRQFYTRNSSIKHSRYSLHCFSLLGFSYWVNPYRAVVVSCNYLRLALAIVDRSYIRNAADCF